jgi:PhnB protein
MARFAPENVGFAPSRHGFVYYIWKTKAGLQEESMSSKLNPYLSFRDNAREAMEFYKAAFGGTLTISTFKEYHASQDPREDNLVMHSVLDSGNGIYFMAADTPSRMEFKPGTNMSMSLSGDNQAELTDWFNKLSKGGTVKEPLKKAPWGDTFGWLNDKFGITWMVNIAGKKA